MDSAPINNYKGVMLCNRPNENIFVPKERPFCSRVQPPEALGITVPRKLDEPQAYSKQTGPNPILIRHKKWLEDYKLQIQCRKQADLEEQVKEDEKFYKVREMAKKDREVTKKMKEEYKAMNELIMKEIYNKNVDEQQDKPKVVKLTEQNLKKLEEKPTKVKKNKDLKPTWALTKEEHDEKAEQEEEDLLNFVQNLDYDQYVNDLEVRVMLQSIQQRVDELRKDSNWREKAQNDYDEKKSLKIQQKAAQNKPAEDMYDRISQTLNNNEDAKTVQSEKTQGILQSYKNHQFNRKYYKIKRETNSRKIGKIRMGQNGKKFVKKKQFYQTVSEKKNIQLEDRIAKHVADEILRTYKNLGDVHSNNSIRKILEREAKKSLMEGISNNLNQLQRYTCRTCHQHDKKHRQNKEQN